MNTSLTKDIFVLFRLVPTTEEYVRCQAPCHHAEVLFYLIFYLNFILFNIHTCAL